VIRARRDLCGGCSAMGIPTASIGQEQTPTKGSFPEAPSQRTARYRRPSALVRWCPTRSATRFLWRAQTSLTLVKDPNSTGTLNATRVDPSERYDCPISDAFGKSCLPERSEYRVFKRSCTHQSRTATSQFLRDGHLPAAVCMLLGPSVFQRSREELLALRTGFLNIVCVSRTRAFSRAQRGFLAACRLRLSNTVQAFSPAAVHSNLTFEGDRS
jgi:hypothetical protein